MTLSPFEEYRFPLSDVLPSKEKLADYMHLEDPLHPAYIFMQEKLGELADEPLEAVGGYAVYSVKRANVHEGVLQLDEGELYLNRQVCGYLKEATSAAFFLCTAGEVFTKQYMSYSERKDYLEAYVLDSIGSLTVENAMDKIQQSLSEKCEAKGLHVSNRYSPGYCNWPLTEQKDLFRLVEGNNTHIQLSESCLMYPTKSVSGIIGIGEKVKRREYGCKICTNANCIYRRLFQNDK
jgi:hypothetical protein